MTETIVGAPQDLAERLSRLDANIAHNFTEDVLTKIVTAHEPDRPCAFVIDGKPCTAHGTTYFLNTPGEGMPEVTIFGNYDLVIVLDPTKQGINRTVKISPDRIVQPMSGPARAMYEELLEMDEVQASQLLETVGDIVNRSMEYDFAKVIQERRETRQSYMEKDELEAHLHKLDAQLHDNDYQPTGEEVHKGVCHNSGTLIREMLDSLNIEGLYFTMVSATGETVSHDTTIVLDTDTGQWDVINSKSPSKPYNLVPQERLAELGTTYTAL